MVEFLNACQSPPILPATITLLIVLVYWVLVILGAFDIDFIDFDFDLDANADSLIGVGFVPLKFFNLGAVPLMVWFSAFAICFWAAAQVFDGTIWVQDWAEADGWSLAKSLVRSGGVALFGAKFLTAPLGRFFHPTEPVRAGEMAGCLGVVMTGTVDETTGQAQFRVNGSPLLLNVRTTEGTLEKATAEIIEYDENKSIYYVQSTSREV